MTYEQATLFSSNKMATRIGNVSLASIDSAISSVLSELESISSLKNEQRTALEAFVGGKDVFALLPTGYEKSLLRRGTTSRSLVKVIG